MVKKPQRDVVNAKRDKKGRRHVNRVVDVAKECNSAEKNRRNNK